MNSDRMWPEHIVSGFFHLTWMTLLVISLLDSSTSQILAQLSVLSTAGATLLGTTVIGASFFLGGLSSRLLSDLSGLIGKRQTEQELLLVLRQDPLAVKALESRWAMKSLNRSVGAAIPFIMLFASILDARQQSGKALCAIILTGSIVEALTVIAFFTQRDSHWKLWHQMTSNQQSSTRHQKK